MLERKFRPRARSIATTIMAMPTKKPTMDSKRAKSFEARLKSGAVAHMPPTMSRIAVETTIGIERVSYGSRGLSRLLLLLCSGLCGRFLFGLGFWHYKGLFGQDFFLNLRWNFWENWGNGRCYLLYDSGDSLTCWSCSGRMLSVAQGTPGVEGYSGF